MTRNRWVVLLLALAAFALRIYGLNWDDGHFFHPDERYILMVSQRLALPPTLTLASIADPASPLNPHAFAYGSFLFYLLALVTQFVAWASGYTQQITGVLRADMDTMRYVGRVLSAIFDTGTVLLVYALGSRLYDRRVGILAASFVTLSVLGIQLSHFYASDTLLTFFIVAAVFCAYRVARVPTVANSLALGILVGLALSSKISALPILAMVLVAHGLHLFRGSLQPEPGEDGAYPLTGTALRADGGYPGETVGWRGRRPGVGALARSLLLVAMTLASGVATFAIIQPYAVLDFRAFAGDIVGQSEMVRGIADLPYTRQYANTAPYMYFLWNLVIWGMGIPLGILTLAGCALVVGRNALIPRRADLLLLSWVLPYFAVTGSFHTKFMRYLLPILPFLCIFAAVAAVFLIERSGRYARYARVAVGLVLAATAFYALSFASVYSAPHTAVAASRWTYENAPRSSSFAIEHWEQGMPVGVDIGKIHYGPETQNYSVSMLNLYEDDNQVKVNHIVQVLSASDYIILYSNRLYGSIPRLPSRYPVTSEYYRLLFSGELGFVLEAYFTSYPNLLGVSFVDDTFSAPGLPVPGPLRGLAPSPLSLNLGPADESHTVYDHPKVLVFRKKSFSADGVRARLERRLGTNPGGTALMLTSTQQGIMEASGTFRELFDVDDFANRHPIAVWALVVELLGLATFPIAYLLLPGLRDRGYLLSKTLGILLLGWLSWISVSVGLARNDRTILFVAAGAILILGTAALACRRQEIADFARRRLGLLLCGETIFWLAFAIFVAIRMANPDLWHPYRGGEKPMDLAYLMATIKSASFPPYDPWFAGGYLNYYYFGQVIVASLVKLTGIVPTAAYNLAVPLLYALTTVGAFSVGHSLGHRFHPRSARWAAAVSGGSAALFATVLGNLGGALQVVDQAARLASRGTEPPAGSASLAPAAMGLWQVMTGAIKLDFPSDWYWASTRIIERTINEFPFFTFLYADLHAHMIALPFTVLAIAIAVSLLDSGTQPVSGRVREISREAPTLLLAGLVLGGLYTINSWDFPTYALVMGSALILPLLARRPSPWEVVVAAAKTACVAGLAILLYLPFHQSFRSFYTGVEPFPDKSPLSHFAVIHGLFLFIIVTYLASSVLARRSRGLTLRSICLFAGRPSKTRRTIHLCRILGRRNASELVGSAYELALLIGMVALFTWIGLSLIAALFVLLVAVIFCLSRRSLAHEQFLLVLVGLGLALSTAVEFIAIKGDVGRMNTVFKFYLQVWLLWSIASAVALPVVLGRMRSPRFKSFKVFWVVLLVALVSAAGVYPIIATRARTEDRFDRSVPPTLDGTAYMERAEYSDQNRAISLSSDLKAIRWIESNVDGSPVILEAQTPLYRWGSRVSIYTGLPTVLGWDWHQKQQRWDYQSQVDQRVADVRAMYTDPSVEKRVALLRNYRVKYIYVGELELAYYPPDSLGKFDEMVGQILEIAYDKDGVRIYRVKG